MELQFPAGYEMHPVVVNSELVIASAGVKCVLQCLERLGCPDREVERL